MFHWICPGCGCELPSSAKQCGACDPKAALAPPSIGDVDPPADPILELAEQIRAVQLTPPQSVSLSMTELAAAVNGARSSEPIPRAETPRVTNQEWLRPEIPSVAALLPGPRPVALLAAGSPASVPAETLPLGMAPAVQSGAERATDDAIGERPPSGSWLALAPLQDYTAAASRAIQPAPPGPPQLRSGSGLTMTLPGPALPAGLAALQGAKVVTVLGNPRPPGRRFAGWMVSALVMLSIPLAGAALMVYFQPQHSSAESIAPAPVQQATQAPAVPQAQAAPLSVAPAHSLSDYVEVTGFRFVMDSNKKPEIHYLVVNHSATPITGMTLYVTLRTASAKAGQPPLCRFSLRAPELAPFASKEMTSPIEKMGKSVMLPDWQELHAEVQIGQ